MVFGLTEHVPTLSGAGSGVNALVYGSFGRCGGVRGPVLGAESVAGAGTEPRAPGALLRAPRRKGGVVQSVRTFS